MNEWDQEKFTAFLESRSSGLVYFYTPMCGTCQVASKMLRVIQELVELEIGIMNLNFYPLIAADLAIESVPCLLFIKDGKAAEKIYAFHSVPFLIDKINTFIMAGA
jgi:thioredoxin-like negative regulator of GroEL